MITLARMNAEIAQVNTTLGWRTGDNTFGEYIALLHTEVAEALEAYRDHRLADATAGSTADDHQLGPSKPEGVGSELADVLIRLIDTCDVFGLPLFDMDCELADVAIVPPALRNTAEPLTTFGDHCAWLHGCIHAFWYTRNGAELLRALVTVAERHGIDLTAEYTRKIAYNRTRSYQHGGRTVAGPR